jgi:hypothetical protein
MSAIGAGILIGPARDRQINGVSSISVSIVRVGLENSLSETVIFDWTTWGEFRLNDLWRDVIGRRFFKMWFCLVTGQRHRQGVKK